MQLERGIDRATTSARDVVGPSRPSGRRASRRPRDISKHVASETSRGSAGAPERFAGATGGFSYGSLVADSGPRHAT